MTFERTHDHAEIVRLYQSGMSIGAITKRVGCGYSTVERALFRAGVDLVPVNRRVRTPPAPKDTLLRQLIEVAGIDTLTNKLVARHAGYSPTAVSYWLRGKRSPSLNAFNDLAEALGCEIIIRKKDQD